MGLLFLGFISGFFPWVNTIIGNLMLWELEDSEIVAIFFFLVPFIFLVLTAVTRKKNVVYRIFSALYVLNILLALLFVFVMINDFDEIISETDYGLLGVAEPGLGAYITLILFFVALGVGLMMLFKRRKKQLIAPMNAPRP